MRFYTVISVTSGLYLTLGLTISPSAHAQGNNAFFEKGVVEDIGGEPLVILQPATIRMLPEKSKAKAKQKVTPPESSAQPEQPKKEPASVEAAVENLSPREQLLRQYGDPEKIPEIKPVESAPGPFKALMASLEAGEKDLAYQYALQYARYLRHTQDSVAKVMSYMGTAMEQEGQLRPGDWQSTPEYSASRAEIDAQLVPKSNHTINSLSSNARDLLKQAEQQVMLSEEEPSGTEEGADNSEQAERKKIRMALAGKVPVDPQGKVDVYVFLNPTDRASQIMGSEISRFYKDLSDYENVKVAVFTNTKSEPGQLEMFRQVSGMQLPVGNGTRLVEQLGIKSFPTTVYVAETTGKSVTQQGFQRSAYIDEIVKIMQGGAR